MILSSHLLVGFICISKLSAWPFLYLDSRLYNHFFSVADKYHPFLLTPSIDSGNNFNISVTWGASLLRYTCHRDRNVDVLMLTYPTTPWFHKLHSDAHHGFSNKANIFSWSTKACEITHSLIRRMLDDTIKWYRGSYPANRQTSFGLLLSIFYANSITDVILHYMCTVGEWYTCT